MARRTGTAAPSRIRAAERRRLAVELRMRGRTFASIANDLGYANEAGVRKTVAKAMVEANAAAQEVIDETRQLELIRLDALQLRLWAKRGDPRIADVILRIMDRRIKLLGLKMPPSLPPREAVAPLPEPYDWSRLSFEE